ncbi:hypothetical protein [Streptomyces sp. SM12]|uniref:hypothetical protein n=1 Tax=Streptomyces sp. SM12 TaxID=1071602 RepID=UPI000CD4AF88|nr:hypothetical protein [Streptomyces sp. SM12]
MKNRPPTQRQRDAAVLLEQISGLHRSEWLPASNGRESPERLEYITDLLLATDALGAAYGQEMAWLWRIAQGEDDQLLHGVLAEHAVTDGAPDRRAAPVAA